MSNKSVDESTESATTSEDREAILVAEAEPSNEALDDTLLALDFRHFGALAW